MSQDRLTAFRLLSYYWLTIIMPPNALTFNVAYNKDPSSSSSIQSSAFYQSSRKFGGYRIVPRACKDSSGDTSYKNDVSGGGGRGVGGVCMFNFECTQMGGSVVGSCVDVFLFGACCQLPAGAKVPTMDHNVATTPTTITSGRPATAGMPYDGQSPAHLSFQQPMADTILLHRNGSAVQNAYSPDDMSADLLANFTAAASLMHANRWQPPPQSPSDDATDVLQQYVTDGHKHRRPPFAGVTTTTTTQNHNKITSKVDYGDVVKQTPSWSSSSWSSSSSSSSSPVSKSTDSVPNIRKTTPSAVHTTTSKQGYGDDYYDGMVLIPTLTAHDPVKTPVENNSIHHILSILNHTPPTSASSGGDDNVHDQDPMDTSSSYQHHSQSTGSPSSPALYTWGSIEGDTKTAGYGSSTFPVTRPTTSTHSSYYPPSQHYDRPATTNNNYYGSMPSTSTSTSTHHLPGPHFHVMSTTAKPVEPAAPTVIVLSSANDVKNPNKYSSTTTATVYASSLSSYRPPPPSQSIIVTGKPLVSAAYTTTATFHPQQTYQPHQQPYQPQQQQNLAFPVGSTTLADKYYNSNNNNNNYLQQTNSIVHTSVKPSMSSIKPTYGHRPSTITAPTTLPPTLSSTVHHDNGNNNNNNNNVFTTVITSVNHQYHKYQPTTASTYSTAKPVLNHDVSSSTSGYRPQVQSSTVTVSGADEDYPSPPVVTPATQMFITASDVHHIHHLQQHTSSSSYPAAGDTSAVYGDAAAAGVPFNSTDTFAFPPVRDPNVNMTAAVVAAASQQEKPDAAIGGGVDTGDGDYEADTDSNPQLTADENLDDKVHLFVEKVVQSLQGNFEDLEKVLLSGDAPSSNVTISNDDPGSTSSWPPNKKPTTTTRKPPKPVPQTGKPTKPPPTKPVTTTYRPTPITPPLDAAPYLELTSTAKPTKIPTLLTPVQLFQPTTYTARPPVKQPIKVTATTVLLDTFTVEHDHTTTAEPDFRKVCGVRPLVRKNGRIVGGTGSTFGEWPWQVLVREATWLGLFTKNKCGGVLITQKHVITAAHCQPGFLANLVAVFGEYDITGEVESKRSISKNVKRVIVHRQYDPATFENDIALLELESPISYDQHIVPICMPDDDDDFTGRIASVTGWGRLKYGGGVPSILQEVQVPIIENQVCQDMFETAGHTKTILSSFLCAGYANGQRDSCEGDSGGPLMIEKDNGRWTLIGTVSHGIKCAAPYLPGVYMRTTYYKPWLQTITGVQ